MQRFFFLITGLVFFQACLPYKPRGAFEPQHIPPEPDYASLSVWAAHPALQDPSDLAPQHKLDALAWQDSVDVFFIHPTTLTGNKRWQRAWNGNVYDEQLNNKTDQTAILYQATIFNGAGRVYAPRYRQAHLEAFFTADKTTSKAALELAYADVKASFQYYLNHWNQGKPFIIAAHSQGARHALELIREMVDGTPLQHQLVAAYLVGWPIAVDAFLHLPPCEKPDETQCYCSWRTWERKSGCEKPIEMGIVCTNPLNWRIEQGLYAPASLNEGGVLRQFDVVYPHVTDAEVYGGILLAARPKFKGSFFFRKKNYHIGDLNLYYMNVRENAELRVQRHLTGK